MPIVTEQPQRLSTGCKRVVILNSKGGSGKTTLATNLAAALRMRGQGVAIYDHDKQGSSSHWLRVRQPTNMAITGVEAFRPTPAHMTRSFFLRTPPGTQWAIEDTPAGVDDHALRQFVAHADVILVPVMPSPTDIHAVTRFIERLLVVGRARAMSCQIGIVANRVKLNMDVYRKLRCFLDALKLPVVAQLHDSHHYVKAAMDGLGVIELAEQHGTCDADEWNKLTAWLGVEPVSSPSNVVPIKPESAAPTTIVAA